MAKLTISAIITAYNCASHVQDAIESVYVQTYAVDEIIVIDDGSIDDTVAIVQKFPDIKIVQQSNSGAGAARNRGIKESYGDFIAFLDCDDIWFPDKIERQVAFLNTHPDYSMVSGNKIWWDVEKDSKRLFEYSEKQRANIKYEIAMQNCIGNPSMALIRRDILEQLQGFDESLRWGQDWELWARIVHSGKIGFLTDPVIIYRWHSDNLSHLNKEARLICLYSIARRNIAVFLPIWQHPWAYLRKLSDFEFKRTRLMAQKDNYWLHLYHSLIAVSYPFENFTEKIKRLARAIISEKFYQRLLRRFRSTS